MLYSLIPTNPPLNPKTLNLNPWAGAGGFGISRAGPPGMKAAGSLGFNVSRL